MKVLFSVFAVLMASVTMAGAAALTNKDTESRTVVVTEGGVRSEIAVAAGETVTICDSGCFLTFPNGDRIALSGDETVSIVNGGIAVE